MYYAAVIFSSFLVVVCGQQIGTQTTENNPALSIQECATGGKCETLSTSVTADANWRRLHSTSGNTSCFTNQTWDASLCPDPIACAQNCALEGGDYANTYGITSTGNALTLKLVTHNSGSTNVGSRIYLLANDTSYQMFNLKNQEFTFDVDVSNLPCGVNGALYFVEMDADGGVSKYPNNKAGAKYGTGYCDAQCPHSVKFINGEANLPDNSTTGKYGSCCSEMDIWEANAEATAYTPHVCTVQGQTRCSGIDCSANGVCDETGCDFNSYRMGNTSFFGIGMTVDTSSKFTVVTQFITTDHTNTGALTEIRRLYVQDGKVIQNSKVNIPNMKAYDSITDAYCLDESTVFNVTNSFETRGGLNGMGQALDRGMVLALSLWDDHSANMLWLDGSFPINKSTSLPGVIRGPCTASSGIPSDVESQSPDSSVTFSNIKFGDIGSTFETCGDPY